MTTANNLFLSCIVTILIIVYKINIYKKYKKNNKKTILKEKSSTFIRYLYLISILIFIITFFLIPSKTDLSLLNKIINSLSVAILLIPLSFNTLYITSFKDEEKYSHIKTIVTNDLNLKIIKKLKQAGINTIILNKYSPSSSNIKVITEDEVNKSIIDKTLVIKTTNSKILNEIIDKEKTLFELKDLRKAYDIVYNARGTHDNYIRTIKYLINTYLSLILSYIFLSIIGFPITYNLLLIILLKVSTILISEYLYKTLTYDNDLMERKVENEDIFLFNQEIFLTIISAFCIFFFITIPYMFILSQGGSIKTANTIFIIIYIYSNLFLTFSLFSESSIFVNIFKALKNKKIILYIFVTIIVTILVNFCSFFNTENIYIKNYISCLIFGFLSILFLELAKLARFTTLKGSRKNGNKNNKKYRRSKFNNS